MTNEELAELIQVTDSKTAKAELWKQNQGIIVMYAQRYSNALSVPLDDAIQECYFSMLQAVKYYDSNKPYKFTTYLSQTIKNTIKRLQGFKLSDISIDADVGTDEQNTTILDYIPDNETLEVIEYSLNLTDIQRAVNNALTRLDSRQRDIIVSTYYHENTLENIACSLNVTRERVRQIKSKALTTLRADAELINLYNDETKNQSIKQLTKSADNPENVESREALKKRIQEEQENQRRERAEFDKQCYEYSKRYVAEHDCENTENYKAFMKFIEIYERTSGLLAVS